MSKFQDFLVTKTFKNIMAKLYGLGAAVVIAGALFKIMHWPGANVMLILGMSTEVLIFVVSAFEPIHAEIDWTLAYPELAGMHGDGHGHGAEKEEEVPLTEQLDTMLEDAKIGPELIESLGVGLKSLSDSTSKMSNISDASVATNEFTDNMKNASKKIGTLSESYDKASGAIGESISDLEKASGRTAQALDLITNSTQQQAGAYGEQLQKVSKNLNDLNASYELQSKMLSGLNNSYQSFEKVMTSLGDTTEDAKKFKTQIAALTGNLESLNTIYGNMLTAMSLGKK